MLAVVAWLAGPAAVAAPHDDSLVADLSNHLVAITTGFAGATVVLFGAVEGDGDVVVVVRGPAQAEIVRRQERVLGIWVNSAQAVVNDAPVYYRIATSRTLGEVTTPAVLDRHQIGVDHLDLRVRRKDKAASDADYRRALLRLKEKAGLYSADPGWSASSAVGCSAPRWIFRPMCRLVSTPWKFICCAEARW